MPESLLSNVKTRMQSSKNRCKRGRSSKTDPIPSCRETPRFSDLSNLSYQITPAQQTTDGSYRPIDFMDSPIGFQPENFEFQNGTSGFLFGMPDDHWTMGQQFERHKHSLIDTTFYNSPQYSDFFALSDWAKVNSNLFESSGPTQSPIFQPTHYPSLQEGFELSSTNPSEFIQSNFHVNSNLYSPLCHQFLNSSYSVPPPLSDVPKFEFPNIQIEQQLKDSAEPILTLIQTILSSPKDVFPLGAALVADICQAIPSGGMAQAEPLIRNLINYVMERTEALERSPTESGNITIQTVPQQLSHFQ